MTQGPGSTSGGRRGAPAGLPQRVCRPAPRRRTLPARLLALAGACLVLVPPSVRAETATACGRLAAATLPRARIVSAEWVAAGSRIVLWSGAQPTPVTRAFCRVAARASPVRGSRIGFELWLPAATDWNGKYL